MTRVAEPAAHPGPPDRPDHGPWRRLRIAGHAAAASVVVAGVAVNVWRPRATPLGDLDPVTGVAPELLARIEAYQQPRYLAWLAALLLQLTVVALAAWSPPGRAAVARIVRRVGVVRPGRAAAAVVVAVLASADLVALPLRFWVGFVHEGDYGFRTRSLPGWVWDWTVAHAPGWLVAGFLTLVAYAVVRRLPRAWPQTLALVGAMLVALGVFVVPIVLEPLRFTTTPLTDPGVRAAVERVVDAAELEVDDLLVADASKRTTKHNAYVSGLGVSQQIVLYDTLVDGAPPDEVALVVAHELGHQLHRDVARGTALGAAGVVATVYLLAAVVRGRTRRGAQVGQADPRAAAILCAVVVLLSVASAPVQSAFSRQAERAADQASLNLTQAPEVYQRVHRGFAARNLSNPAPPAWARVMWGTHPTVAERLTMGARWPFDESDTGEAS